MTLFITGTEGQSMHKLERVYLFYLDRKDTKYIVN